ncbi:hypothetical protein BH09ACT13_BH09ACT13_15090 [soil metagenome]
MNELAPGWALSTVGEVGKVMLGRQRAPRYHKGPNMRPYLRVKNVFENRIDLSDVKTMEFSPADYERYRLEPGDILLNEGQSPELIGRSAMYRGELPGACFTNSLIRFQPHDGIDGRFALFVFLHHLRSGRFMREARITTNIAHLSSSRFSSVEFPVPPLNEQRRIVAAIEVQLSRLDAADASLAAARRRLRAILRPIRERAIESGLERTLGELLNGIEAGKSFKCHSRAADPDEWGVVKVSAMTWGIFNERENKAVISDERVDTRWEINPGDLLLSRANTTDYVGATVLVGECRNRLLLSDESMRLLVADGVHRPWLLHALSAPGVRAQMSAVATGTSDSMRNISQAKVNSIRLRVPPLEEQRRIVAEVEERLSVIDAMRASIERAERRSATLRRSILERAFRGELVPQDPSDEPASVLLDRIRAKRDAGDADHGSRRRRTDLR